MRDLVEYIVKHLVDHPDEVEVTTVEEGYGVTYQVWVAEGDLGQVIGRQGRIANALRTIAKSIHTSDGKRHTVDIMS